MRTIRQSFLLAGKDLALELRTKESLNAAAAFSVVILLLFSFVIDPGTEEAKEFGSGMLWLVFAFAGALVFNRGFSRELPNECLDTLLASPLSAASLVLGKAIANLAMLIVVEIISLVVFGLFFDIRWWLRPAELAGVSFLATWGISVIGSVFGALTVNLRLRELMLPVLIYPLLLPLLMGAIETSIKILANQPFTDYEWLWMRVLVVFDVIFTSLALALADTILVN
ncbi:MAG TPA: heme exporter protein CcmB [Bryobacteraceae bacterium]|nr:heme exporter protein CcmB [Bryobacteraceae bacterium]